MTIRILLVEDDPVSRDLLAALLDARGYKVETADDGFSALNMAQEQRYDLVFVDYHLPEMDGYALARLLRSLGEKTNNNMKMVAITADRFGLAARRGVDTIFDRLLTKPIEPDVLYALVDEFLETGTPALDSFFAEPTTQDAQTAAQVLWRVRGIGSLPAAAVFPEPSGAERASLQYCFRLVEAASADCIVVTREEGLPEVEKARAQAKAFLQPLFALDEKQADLADVLFKIGDGDSWSAAAEAITTFSARREMLEAGIAEAVDVETRLLAYLSIAAKDLILRRDTFGRTLVPYTGGFSSASILEAVKSLVARGLMTAKPSDKAPEGTRELLVTLTPKGIGYVAGKGAASLPVAG